jgi:hypothetical protein
MQAHLLYEFGAQVNVMTEIVNPDLQALKRERRSETGESEGGCLFRVAPEAENRDARHLWESSL